ncbi:MAG: peptide chain release factor aRF-1, partial [Deltaproteobacteria bacterium]|nr:peptide chain release factor aRF-1 [Deltaproteobacteria bacterium]
MKDKMNELRAITEELGKIRGRHTELVTVYVPAGYGLVKIVQQIKSEQGTAMNIKSKAVRKNVEGALEKILQHMKLYKQTPKNGLAIFCGNVSDREGITDMEIWAIEPPEPLKTKLYRCDQIFVLDPLKDMIREREIYGLILFDKSEATIGILKGKKIEVLKHMDSIVPGKTRAGGWSANRYARIREGMMNDFMKKIGDIASQTFKDFKDFLGLIIGGPGPNKEHFADGDYLDYKMKDKILGIVDTSYTGESGLREIVERAEDILAEASVTKERKILENFFDVLGKDTGLAVYGVKETVEAIEAGNLETMIISEDFDWVNVGFECPACREKFEKVLDKKQIDSQKCKCGKKPNVISEKELTEDIIESAENMGTKVFIVSSSTGMGE